MYNIYYNFSFHHDVNKKKSLIIQGYLKGKS